MRNSIKRITHKERSQPAARKRFGLLEKHKDYIERAKVSVLPYHNSFDDINEL
jgi:U3 small nucleolar RNA-associated protein 11